MNTKYFMNVTERNGFVKSVKGKTRSERIRNYLLYMNELCLDQTGEEMSFEDVMGIIDNEEFEYLFD